MPFTTPHLLWKEDYLQREREFMEYIKYVPPSKEHSEVWSLELANQLLLIGSSIDSFFKFAVREHLNLFFNEYFKKIKYHQAYDSSLLVDKQYLLDRLEVSEKKKSGSRKVPFLNLGDYNAIFDHLYNLSERKVTFLPTKDTIIPFENWKNNGSLSWWNAYTDIKHSRFKNRKSATLKAAMEALAALFLLNVYHPSNRKYLADIDVIDIELGERYKNQLMEILEQENINETSSFTPVAHTDLFAYIFSDQYDWYKHNEQWKLLDPNNIYNRRSL